MRAHFGLPSVVADDTEGRPPIHVRFEIPYFTVSGIQVHCYTVLTIVITLNVSFYHAYISVESVILKEILAAVAERMLIQNISAKFGCCIS